MATQSLDTAMEKAQATLTRAGEAYATALAEESRLHSLRGLEKAQAIGRIVGTEDPLTGRAHSATSAEKVVEQDGAYSLFLSECRASVITRIQRETEYENAKLTAWIIARGVVLQSSDRGF